MQRGFQNYMLIPGWQCTCGVFNSAEKEWLLNCRACGDPRYAPVYPEIIAVKKKCSPGCRHEGCK